MIAAAGPACARNIWELALRQWFRQEASKKEPDLQMCERITASLANLEREAGRWRQSVDYLEMLKQVSPVPDKIQKQIEELQQRLK
ncbi:MAG: hypothetical protein HYZ36_04615 [Pedosphaera parvula]|nr:hypothetical protein [Pedosphaera parvula]